MSPTSDTNIVGDDITNSASPTFIGTITEPNPTLVPLAGQTAILNVGIALDVNGTIETSSRQPAPRNLSSYAQYIRPDAGTGLTDANGNFSVTVGVDAANTGLVTNTSPLPDLFPIYNVGSSGNAVSRARHRQRLLRRPGDRPSTRAATSPTPTTPAPSSRSSSTTRPRRPSSSPRRPAR